MRTLVQQKKKPHNTRFTKCNEQETVKVSSIQKNKIKHIRHPKGYYLGAHSLIVKRAMVIVTARTID